MTPPRRRLRRRRPARRALEERWPIKELARPAIANELTKLVVHPEVEPQIKMRAAAVLVQIDRLNLQQRARQERANRAVAPGSCSTQPAVSAGIEELNEAELDREIAQRLARVAPAGETPGAPVVTEA